MQNNNKELDRATLRYLMSDEACFHMKMPSVHTNENRQLIGECELHGTVDIAKTCNDCKDEESLWTQERDECEAGML